MNEKYGLKAYLFISKEKIGVKQDIFIFEKICCVKFCCMMMYLQKISTKTSGIKCVYEITAHTISVINLLKPTVSLNFIFTEFPVVTDLSKQHSNFNAA